MKSQAKRSPSRSCLASRSWRRFSPTSSTPASASAPHLLGDHVLGRGEDLDVGAAALTDPLEVGADDCPGRCRGSAQPSTSIHASPAWRPVRPVVAAVGEEQLRVAARAQVGGLDRIDAGAGEQPPRDLGQVEHAPVGDAVAEPGERRQDLVADLVAAGADPRPDRRRARPDLPRPALDDPAGEPAPAAVEHRDPALAGERHRQAVGDLDERRSGAGFAVSWPSNSSVSGTREVNGFGSGALSRADDRRLRGPGGRRAPGRRRGPERRAGAVRFAYTASLRSSVSRPRLSDSKSPSLVAADAGRERRPRARKFGLEPANAVLLAPSIVAPEASRGSGARSFERDPQLVVAVAAAAVELRPQGRLRARGRPRGPGRCRRRAGPRR